MDYVSAQTATGEARSEAGQEFFNITDQQKTLLLLLIMQDVLNAGAQFILVRSLGGAGLIYPGGISTTCSYEDTDFSQLSAVGLITLSRNSDSERLDSMD